MEQSVDAYPDFAAWRAGLAHVYCLVGRHAEAAEIVQRAAADRFASVAHDQTYKTALALYSDAAAQANLPGPAKILYELIEPWAEQMVWNGATGFGHTRMWLGLLAATIGWDDIADDHLSHASEVQESSGVLLWAAYSRLGWGEALARRGEAARAREQGARALELARERGYGAFEHRAAALVAGHARA